MEQSSASAECTARYRLRWWPVRLRLRVHRPATRSSPRQDGGELSAFCGCGGVIAYGSGEGAYEYKHNDDDDNNNYY